MATDPYAAFAVQVSGPSPVQQQPRAPRQAPAQYLGPMPAAARDVFPSLIHQESRGRAGVSGPQTRYGVAQGRTQVLPDTARGVARNLGIPYRPELMTGTSPEAAAYQDQIGLGYLEEAFSNTSNAREALMYYHGGPNRALWGPKTNAYADEVLEKWSRGVGVDPVATAPTASLVSANAGADPYAEFAAPVEEAADDSGAPIEVEIDAGVRNIDGRAIVIHRDGTREDHGPWDRYWADQERSRQARLARLEREEDPEYQRAMVDARAGAEAVPDRLRALGLGGTLGFLTDINAEAQRGFQAAENIGRRIRGEEIQYSSGMAAQAARDAMRDAQAGYAAERPLENFALQAAGGFLAPGLGASANYVNAGRAAGGATLQSGRMARAAQVGAGYGLAGGIGNAEGNIIERLPEGAQGAAIGAGAGAILQGGADRFLTPRARPAESGGAARRLSRGGVDLMPGQMAAEVPVVGPVIRNFEDVLAGYNPLVPGVRKRQNEDVIRIAGNEALGEVGESLARTDRTVPARQPRSG